MPPAAKTEFRVITIRLDADTLDAAAEVLGKQIERAQHVTAAAARELELDDSTKDKRTSALLIVKELARAGRLAELAKELRSGWDAAGDPAAEAARHLDLTAAAGPMPRNREEFVKALRAQTDRVNAADPLDPEQPSPTLDLDADPDAAAVAEGLDALETASAGDSEEAPPA